MGYNSPYSGYKQIRMLPFRGAFAGKSSNASSQRLINLYVEAMPQESGEVSNVILYKTPGLTKVNSVGVGPIRGSIVHINNVYFISGPDLYKMDVNEAVSLVFGGFLGTSAGNITLASNGSFNNEIIVVDGTTSMYVWNSSTNTRTVVATPARPFGVGNAVPTSVVYMNGYFLINDNGFGWFFRSRFNDGTDTGTDGWNVLNFATAEKDPDNIVGLAVTHKELYLIGENSTEVWYNSGAEFPFDPVPNTFIEYGCVSQSSISTIQDSTLFISQTKNGVAQVLMIVGGETSVVSTQQLTYELSTYSKLSDAVSFVYEREGHIFYELIFPTANKSWLYDLSTSTWSEIQSGYLPAGTMGKHRVSVASYLNGNIYLGSNESSDSSIYKFSSNKYDEAIGTLDTVGQEHKFIRSVVITPSINVNNNKVFHHSFEVVAETGVGTISGAGSNPQLMLSWSDDGGHTYSSESWGSLGQSPGGIGEYTKRIKFLCLGQSLHRVYKIEISDPVKLVILDIVLVYSVGYH